MAISLVTLLDTFLTWMNRTNEVINVANLATEGQLNTSGTLTITNAGGVAGGISLNVSSGLIKGDAGLLTNVPIASGAITNAKLANNNIRFASNTSSALTVTVAGPGANANLGSIVYITVTASNNINDQSTTNVAAANLVNASYTLATQAYALANSGASAASAFDKANAANALAFTANATAVGAFTAANNNTGGGYFKGNRGTVGSANNVGDLFRINHMYMTANVTINETERAIAVGPITVNSGFVLTIASGGRAVIA